MEVKGMISAVMPVQSGISQRTGNAWMSQEFILDYFWWPNQTTASKMVLRVFGEDRVKSAELTIGKEVTVRYHIEATQGKDRWFNEVRFDGFVESATAQPTTEVAGTERNGIEGNEEEEPF